MAKSYKLRISCDEQYPVYGFSKTSDADDFVVVDATTLSRWERVEADFATMQDELEELWEKQGSDAP